MDFKESDHPRDSDGKFAAGSGGKNAKISKSEEKALSKYTGSGYIRINEDLREGKPPSADVKELDKLIGRSELPKGTTLYRGINKSFAKKLFGESIEKGMVISDPAFSSTTKDEKIGSYRGLGGGVLLKIESGSDAKGLDVDDAVQELDEDGNEEEEYNGIVNPEKEVILPRNAKMTVKNITAPKKEGGPVIVTVSYGDDDAKADAAEALADDGNLGEPTAPVVDPVDPEDVGEPGDTSPTPQRPLKAAGILFMASDGTVLLMRRTGRDHNGEWAFPGGGVEDDETAEQTARREVTEETGQNYQGAVSIWTRRIAEGVDFTTFLAKSEFKFYPVLNDEHDLATWAPLDAALSLPLHPGARVAIQRFNMDELGVAKAIRDGDLTSPQRYASIMLVKLRITGTGASFRPNKKEYVWRDPSLYLNDEFLERCQGLLVLAEHPDKSVLDTKELHDRIAGSILLPFIEDGEVFGIGKIVDQDLAQVIDEDTEISTSPGVLAGGEKIPNKDGSHVLVEDKPFFLDHLAVTLGRPGVWDQFMGYNGVVSVNAQADAVPSQIDLILDSFRNTTRQIRINSLN